MINVYNYESSIFNLIITESDKCISRIFNYNLYLLRNIYLNFEGGIQSIKWSHSFIRELGGHSARIFLAKYCQSEQERLIDI